MIDERELQQKMLSRVATHLGFDSNGRVMIRNPLVYRQRDLIALYLIGVRYAADAGLRPSDTASLAEVSEALGLQNSPYRTEGRCQRVQVVVCTDPVLGLGYGKDFV